MSAFPSLSDHKLLMKIVISKSYFVASVPSAILNHCSGAPRKLHLPRSADTLIMKWPALLSLHEFLEALGTMEHQEDWMAMFSCGP